MMSVHLMSVCRYGSAGALLVVATALNWTPVRAQGQQGIQPYGRPTHASALGSC